jgi:uncharacterized protein YaiI (UPF0178 family)
MILVDGDACPVKREVYEIAIRRGVNVVVVVGSYMKIPTHPLVRIYVAGEGFDAADDAIAAVAGPGHVVITADTLLAHRVIAAGAACLDPKGRAFTPANIGGIVAGRDLAEGLRGGVEGREGAPRGAPPFTARDRAAFRQALDRELTRLASGR